MSPEDAAHVAIRLPPLLTAGRSFKWRAPPPRQHTTYALMGMVLAAGAPLGLLSLRRLLRRQRTSFLRELRDDTITYLYLATTTTVAFALFGRALGRRAEMLVEMSTTDALTGLANVRAFRPRLAWEAERARRSLAPVSLLLVDMDGLKAVNDRHGHAAGDRALRTLARAIRRRIRSIDFAARVGGDEFAVIAPETGAAAAVALTESLRAGIAAESANGVGTQLSASIGVATFDPSRHPLSGITALLDAADGALYAAKRTRRNRSMRD